MNGLALKGLEKYKDAVLLFARLGLCFLFVFVHGGPKLFGGPEKWLEVASMLKVLGITAMPTLLGFIAAVCEFFGGIFIGLGLFTRLGAAMILSTLVVAASVMFAMKGLFAASAAMEDSLLMLVLMVVGAGKYSFDYLWFEKASSSRGSVYIR
jgi:putative oxidoreductase